MTIRLPDEVYATLLYASEFRSIPPSIMLRSWMAEKAEDQQMIFGLTPAKLKKIIAQEKGRKRNRAIE
jgi:hypothetical protein